MTATGVERPVLMTQRMGLGAMLARLIESHTGRRAVNHLHKAAEAEKHAERRYHLRAAIRLARKALSRINGKQ